MSSDSSQPAPLEYAPPVAGSASIRRLRRYFPHLLILITLAAAITWGPDAVRQVWYLRGQSRCMTFEMTPGQVTYANRPEEAAPLLAGGYPPVASVVANSLGN